MKNSEDCLTEDTNISSFNACIVKCGDVETMVLPMENFQGDGAYC
jgi:hypothetical protein